MPRQVVIIGGGIVGSAVADALSHHDGIEVTVLERGPRDALLGSTGHAPGFVSLLSESPVLSALAVASADLYAGLESGSHGFERVGGLEVAVSDDALRHLERRWQMATQLSIRARLLEPDEAWRQAPVFVDRGTCLGGLLFPDDGAARGSVVTAALKARASRGGGPLPLRDRLHGDPAERRPGDGHPHVERGDVARRRRRHRSRHLGCRRGALAGVDLSFTPVAHPYVYGPPRPSYGPARYPFVKWRPETVYARDHGDRSGIGTHTNADPAVDVESLTGADLPWSAEALQPALEQALQLLPPEHRFLPHTRLNGVFSMTADGLPLLGPAKDVEGLWIAESLWITHAGGAAQALADMMTGRAPTVHGLEAMTPQRFAGQHPDHLTARATKNYRRIWMPSGAIEDAADQSDVMMRRA